MKSMFKKKLNLLCVTLSRVFASISGSSQKGSVSLSRSAHFARRLRREILDLKSLSRISGFSLVELLISMGLLSILLVTITSIFTSSLEAQLRSQATSSRQEDAQYILSRLYYEVNQATAITSPATIGQQTNAVTLTINGQAWTYSLSNGNVILTNPSGTFQMNSYLTTVTQFDVIRVGNVGGKAGFKLSLTVGSRITSSQGADTVSYSSTYSIW